MGNKHLTNALTRFALFEGLDQHTRQQMAECMRCQVCPAKQVIVLIGEPCRAIYLIARGAVRIQRSSPEGREYVLDILGPGQCFNLSSALEGLIRRERSRVIVTDLAGLRREAFS